jgi:hypothetical protein
LEALLRKLAIFTPFVSLLFLIPLASAQQADFFIGAGTALSSSPSTAALFFQPPAEKGGTYINLGGDVVGFKRRIGFNIETAWKATQGTYAGENESWTRSDGWHRRGRDPLLRSRSRFLQLFQRRVY